MTPARTPDERQPQAELEQWIRREYDLDGALAPLAGSGENYRLTTSDGREFVLKLAGIDTPAAALDLEQAVVEHVAAAGLALSLPRHVRAASGSVTPPSPGGADTGRRARLLEFAPGTPWIDAGPASARRRRDLGKMLAAVDNVLSTFDHEVARRAHIWDLTAAAQHRAKVALVDDPPRRRLLDRAFHIYASAVPTFPTLPSGVIHGDGNDENVLVDGDAVTGLLDFGDCLYAPTVCELAIALAYALLDEPDPLAAGANVVEGYHGERPISAAEAEVLFPLVLGRLAVTVAIAAGRRQTDPDHPTWFVTEGRAWRLLETLADIDPAAASRRLLAPTGLDPYADRVPPGELIERRRAHVSAALSVAYREPLTITRGRAQFLIDNRGRPFLDLVNNVCHVGHCHPRVVEAGQRQMARLNTNTRYLHAGLSTYAERLVATLPEALEVCFFVNSGSEANELALRLARTHTRRHDVLVVDGAYHGSTGGLIAISPYKFMGPGGAGRPEPWVHVVPMPDGYRGPHRGAGEETGAAYSGEVERAIETSAAPIAAFISESFYSCGGQIIPPAGYFDAVFRDVRAAGGVCIIDEVQTGFGRVGTHFWAFERYDVVPDIVVLGKPIGNGHPIGAVVTTREIAASFENGMEFFSTFGGNPVSCAIGTAVLDVIEDEGLQRHALDVGTRLRDAIRALMDAHRLIGDVRGEGLFIGVELVRDRATLEPADEEAHELVNRLRHRGLLVSTDGPFSNVLKIKPPLVVTVEDVDMVARLLDDELAAMPVR